MAISVSFLDMGTEKYGDCILVRAGELSVLIDGGHQRDLVGQASSLSIPEQLEGIFGHPPPFDVTLLVVTHGHSDHIGCLPEMVDQSTVRPAFALVSDPAHCFPSGARDGVRGEVLLDDTQHEALRRALAGLAEEDQSDLPDRELEVFLDRAARLGDRYRRMMDKLEKDGTSVFFWGTSPVEALQPLYDALEGIGFDIIAPSVPHLELCRDQIVRFSGDARSVLLDTIRNLPAADEAEREKLAARLYRGLAKDAGRGSPGMDRISQGSALNCQSIMLVFGPPEKKLLLTGDMQLADSEVAGLSAHLEFLFQQAADAGPFACIKLPHHSSQNGMTPALWERLGRPSLLVHSGGSDDALHPSLPFLQAFSSLDDQVTFLRTDRNGLITVNLSDGGAPWHVSRGEADDYSANRKRDEAGEGMPFLCGPASRSPVNGTPANIPPVTGPPANIPKGVAPPIPEIEHVDVVVVRLPLDHQLKIGPYTIEVRKAPPAIGSSETRPPRPDGGRRLADGRSLPPLLFVTSGSGLLRNIGKTEAHAAMDLIARDADLFDVDGLEPWRDVHDKLSGGNYSGVVLVGGYDMLPAQRVDVLEPSFRRSWAPEDIAFDPDDFIVWSDDIWADLKGTFTADLPVSRIPDGRSAELVMAALTSDASAPEGAFGIRNAARPFADAVYRLIDDGPALRCVPSHAGHIPTGAAARRNVYFMLHGDDRDGSRFWGDDIRNGQVVEGFNVGAIPARGLDVVFAGCCWGALSVLQRANRPDTELAPRSPGESIALACIGAGARAFVGCTGVHYSPGPEGGFFGDPMHKAFWKEIVSGRPPAEALYLARIDYLKGMPHGRTSAIEIAIERKIYKQFTCLGLGW